MNPAERQFLTQLVAGQGKEFMKRTAGGVTRADTVSVPSVDLTGECPLISVHCGIERGTRPTLG